MKRKLKINLLALAMDYTRKLIAQVGVLCCVVWEKKINFRDRKDQSPENAANSSRFNEIHIQSVANSIHESFVLCFWQWARDAKEKILTFYSSRGQKRLKHQGQQLKKIKCPSWSGSRFTSKAIFSAFLVSLRNKPKSNWIVNQETRNLIKATSSTKFLIFSKPIKQTRDSNGNLIKIDCFICGSRDRSIDYTKSDQNYRLREFNSIAF